MNIIIVHLNEQRQNHVEQLGDLQVKPRDVGNDDIALELYGQSWAWNWKSDIVMLVEVEEAECKHCDLPIHEKPGFVFHRWVHADTDAYLCWSDDHTQAEPKEIE